MTNSVRQRYRQRQQSRVWSVCKHPTRVRTRKAAAAEHSWVDGRAEEVRLCQPAQKAKLGEKIKHFTYHIPSQHHLPLLPCSVQNWMITSILLRFSMLAQNQLQKVSKYPESSNPQRLPSPVSFDEATLFNEKLCWSQIMTEWCFVRSVLSFTISDCLKRYCIS